MLEQKPDGKEVVRLVFFLGGGVADIWGVTLVGEIHCSRHSKPDATFPSYLPQGRGELIGRALLLSDEGSKRL